MSPAVRTGGSVTHLEVLSAVGALGLGTVSEIAGVAVGVDAWALRGTIRNRLYDLRQQGLVIDDGSWPMHFILTNAGEDALYPDDADEGRS